MSILYHQLQQSKTYAHLEKSALLIYIYFNHDLEIIICF